MSLIETLIAMGIMLAISAGMAQFINSQVNQSKGLQETVARMDLEKSLVGSLGNGSICTFILNDGSQASIANPPNRSVDTFNSTLVTSASPLVINVQNIPAGPSASSPSLAKIGDKASALANGVIISAMKFVIQPNLPPDIFLADFHVEFDKASLVRPLKNIVIKNIQIATDTSSPLTAKKIVGCSGWGEPRAQRFSFTTTSTWAVPFGTRKAFITMAGGGGSGAGWRISNAIMTGHSGGYIFSQPVNLVPGETMQIVVGKGGKGYATVNTNVPANPGPPYYIYASPPGDNGLGGHPGEPTKVISPSQGVLIECSGGGGVDVAGVDTYSGTTVAGNVSGATIGSGSPTINSPKRPSTGPYGSSTAGFCGTVGYGLGNVGSQLFNSGSPASGYYAGGTTPFGYGSGGGIGVTGCYVTPSTTGACINPNDGRDGVVFIDVW